MRVVRYLGTLNLNYAARERAFAALRQERHDVVQISPKRGYNECVAESLDTTGFSVHSLYETPLTRLRPREIVTASIGKLVALRPDVLVIGDYSQGFSRAVNRWARRQGAITILITDGHDFSGARRMFPREFVKRMLIRGQYDGVLTAGERGRLYNWRLAFDNVPVVQGMHSVDHEYFRVRAGATRAREAEIRRELALPEQYFVFAGRLSPEKNLLQVLRAYDRYRGSVASPWDLVIVGSGPQEGILRDLHASLGTPGVHWKGWAPYERVVEYFSLAKALVLLSTNEPWGWVVNEAMLCGLPVVISNRCGCAPELVSECENGYWCDPDDVADISYALTRMGLREDWERMSAASRTIVERFSPELYARRLWHCIERARMGRAARKP